MINTLMMSMLIRMELFRSMDIRGTLKVNLCLTPGARISHSPREITHTLAQAQKILQRQMIFPQMSMSLNHTNKAPKTIWNMTEEEDSKPMATITPEIIFK